MMLLAAAMALLLGAAPTANPYRVSPYVGAISVDAQTGATLFEDKADAKAYPASVTKLMTAYLVLEDVKAGRLSLDDMVTASPTVTKADVHYRQASCIGLAAGESMSVDTMLVWLMVHSANDAAVFLAEKCAGSFDAFVARMNEKAAELGMKDTVYYNPNGLPPPKNAKERKFNVSTCRDLAKLAMAVLNDCPEMLRYTSVKVASLDVPVTRDGKRVWEKHNIKNHNNVMVKNTLKVVNPDGTEAVDGLKTGYIDAGGSSVVLTGTRSGKRAIVVVLGSASAPERDANAARLLDDALGALVW
ncbi:MAG: D-alanyl-D-alanine carboxypeptidase [Kiritimatiellae bacterium]|nr:D-alanyl-D-alanine carboxypeptidase [Kiritimatiellia bacterium]